MGNAIIYGVGVISALLGMILYNYGVSNDTEILIAALLIGIGVACLLVSYM